MRLDLSLRARLPFPTTGLLAPAQPADHDLASHHVDPLASITLDPEPPLRREPVGDAPHRGAPLLKAHLPTQRGVERGKIARKILQTTGLQTRASLQNRGSDHI